VFPAFVMSLEGFDFVLPLLFNPLTKVSVHTLWLPGRMHRPLARRHHTPLQDLGSQGSIGCFLGADGAPYWENFEKQMMDVEWGNSQRNAILERDATLKAMQVEATSRNAYIEMLQAQVPPPPPLYPQTHTTPHDSASQLNATLLVLHTTPHHTTGS